MGCTSIEFPQEQRSPGPIHFSRMALAFPLAFLALAQVCMALTMYNDTQSALPILDTVVSIISSDPLPNTCKDIDNCRTLVNIITSCMGTIFACIWVAVHRNIPGPRQSYISIQLQSLKVVLTAVIMPEWVLAWAVRQFLQARVYARSLERIRVRAAAHELRMREENWRGPGMEYANMNEVKLHDMDGAHVGLPGPAADEVNEIVRTNLLGPGYREHHAMEYVDMHEIKPQHMGASREGLVQPATDCVSETVQMDPLGSRSREGVFDVSAEQDRKTYELLCKFLMSTNINVAHVSWIS